MKRIKKLAGLLLAMMMVLSMGLTAFAAETDPVEGAGEESSAEETEATAPTDNTADGNPPAGTGAFTITINDSTEGYVYNAYQIFQGDLNVVDGVKTLSNIQWGDGVDAAKANAAFPNQTAAQVAESLAGDSATNAFDTEAAKEFAAKISECLSNTSTQSSRVGDHYEISGLNAGYYLVLNSGIPQVDGDYTRYMMEVVGDVTATPKRGTLEHDKSIVVKDPEGVEGVDYVKLNEAPIGGIVEYRIPVTLPQNFADYTEYYLEFRDTLTKGLTINAGTIKVMAGDVDITKYFYQGTETITEGDFKDGTTITVSISDLKGLNKIDGITIAADTPIVLTYSATLNEDAVIGIEGNPNYVKVIHSNDPNHSGDGTTTPPENPEKPEPEHPTGQTPDKEVITYTTELTILKTDGEGKFLPGVEFTLSGNGVKVVLVTEEAFTEDAEGEYWKLKDGTYTTTAPTVGDPETDNSADYESTTTKYTKTTTVVAKGEGKGENGAVTEVKGTVQEDGTVTFRGLGAGEYTITESVTLPGYNTIEPITFHIIFTGREFITDNDVIEIGANNALETTIVNQKGSLLPSTGGIGTTIFYVVGGILVIGAGILLVAKKRMSSK